MFPQPALARLRKHRTGCEAPIPVIMLTGSWIFQKNIIIISTEILMNLSDKVLKIVHWFQKKCNASSNLCDGKKIVTILSDKLLAFIEKILNCPEM